MSKILELLKQNKTINSDKTQEQLANTYLFSSKDEKALPHISKRSINIFTITALFVLILLFLGILFYMLSNYAFYGNLLLTQEVSPLGTKNSGSRSIGGYIALTNMGSQRNPGIFIDLKSPIDISSKYLLISIIAKRPGGRLKVIFRDKNYRSYIADILDIKEKRGYQNFIIFANEAKYSIDTRDIRHIRLELEDELKNKRRVELFIKRIALIDK